MPLVESQPNAASNMYARSLLELADQQGGRAVCEEIGSELEQILELGRTDRAFGEFLSSRLIASKARGESLSRILKGRISDLTLRFLLVLNRKGRLASLPAVAASYDQLLQDKFGRVEVDIYTAETADPALLDQVRAQLGKSLGKEVVLHPYTDSRMIGGIKVQIGDQLLDASVATQLRRLADRLDVQGSSELRSRAQRLISES
ncbi:MAG: ATP synthase F1 subunit delta [Planctomycetes bacterium]|nr:ATP synthase F1 subunit delta [Planctomycetota bacterium]